ncbi:hypothetical protein X474_24710 [Dethiosulfatarculus sandiegensis]|uniref:Uncharacterized protein n=1 Tax=Dethiosulfatarculus sandiegensis TaxID=1429043 RepID=A0A0D2J036_9BACT|nr:hypothetical protein X474_24710 [Dethiosulfatarculus sandiegensis]
MKQRARTGLFLTLARQAGIKSNLSVGLWFLPGLPPRAIGSGQEFFRQGVDIGLGCFLSRLGLDQVDLEV